ncbi:ANTAR domain-containing protein [Streptomyces sp. NPDC047070]|uniref:ANTAR domain-containing protein n=1 Tax=Streptomyces sp. NPDC047070 TaxID=3154923 RepID=UPI0034542D3D
MILAARRNITLNEAFDSLSRHARDHRILLSRVARAVIGNGLMPGAAPGQPRTGTPETD